MRHLSAAVATTACALLAAGCGSSSHSSLSVANESAAGQPPCQSVPLTQVSRCALHGDLLHVAHANQPLRLSTLVAQVQSLSIQGGNNGAASTSPAQGATGATGSPAPPANLNVTMQVTNVSSLPQVFNGGQTQVALEVAGKTYLQSSSSLDANSAVNNSPTSPIQPGASIIVDLVFTVPPNVAQHAVALPRAGLFVGNFGDNLGAGPVPPRSGDGFITLHGA